MNPRNLLLIAMGVIGLSLSAPAHATPITFCATGGFSLTTGPDDLGLDGASFTFIATFDSAGVYVDRFSLPSLAALSDSLTITGASTGGVDGTYAEDFGIIFYPTFPGQYFGGAGEGEFAQWTILGNTLQLGYLMDPTGAAMIGDTVSLSDFSLTPSSSFNVFFISADGSEYAIVGLEATLKTGVIPEPSTGALALIGLVSLGAAARRRACRAA